MKTNRPRIIRSIMDAEKVLESLFPGEELQLYSRMWESMDFPLFRFETMQKNSARLLYGFRKAYNHGFFMVRNVQL